MQLYAWNGAQWTRQRDGKTAANGCASWGSLSPTTTHVVRAYVALGNVSIGWHIYDGWTPYMTGTGSGSVSIGTGVARYVGCQPNGNGYCY